MTSVLFSAADVHFVDAISRLQRTNPFTDARRDVERAALGAEFVQGDGPWSAEWTTRANNPNVDAIEARALVLANAVTVRRQGMRLLPDDVTRLVDLQVFALYASHGDALLAIDSKGQSKVAALWDSFLTDANARLNGDGLPTFGIDDAARLFALIFQLRRGFHHIFTRVLGRSTATVRLRARIWESVFTGDMDRYRRVLVERMRDLPTLILGPSGSGKELVALAIAHAAFVPFQVAAKKFTVDEDARFLPLHLAALPRDLVESALFGHVKGSFTGAIADRKGALALASAGSTVMLDEIGEVDAHTQVKLLRVLESRRFTRVGETKELDFAGKIIAATNRDLDVAMSDGSFREDLYYRLCADVIRVPSLIERVRDDGRELDALVQFLSARLVGESEGPKLADAVRVHIADAHAAHDWPGNVRELDQCVRNVLVTGRYEPRRSPFERRDDDVTLFERATSPLEEIVTAYVKRVHRSSGVVEETARRLAVDRRTVQKRLSVDDDANGIDDA